MSKMSNEEKFFHAGSLGRALLSLFRRADQKRSENFWEKQKRIRKEHAIDAFIYGGKYYVVLKYDDKIYTHETDRAEYLSISEAVYGR